MRKHILSSFANEQSTTYRNKLVSKDLLQYGPTVIIETPSDSDPDSFSLYSTGLNISKYGPTYLTEQIESSDPDEFGVISANDLKTDEFVVF